jgi:tetratricopeptide (TPR) repeat protein
MPYATTGWFWFLVTTAPVAGFVRIGYHSIADRYTYIPTIGIFIIMVWLVADLLPENRQGKIIAALVTGAILIPLAAVTWQQTTYWKDNITLFEHNLNVTSNNWVAHGNLGAELLKYNRTQEAVLHLQEAYRINPDSYTTLFNVGHALNRLGNRVEALKAFRKVIELNPGYAEGYFEAGKTSFELGDKALAYEIQASLAHVNPDMAVSLKKYFLLLEQMQLRNQADKP